MCGCSETLGTVVIIGTGSLLFIISSVYGWPQIFWYRENLGKCAGHKNWQGTKVYTHFRASNRSCICLFSVYKADIVADVPGTLSVCSEVGQGMER